MGCASSTSKYDSVNKLVTFLKKVDDENIKSLSPYFKGVLLDFYLSLSTQVEPVSLLNKELRLFSLPESRITWVLREFKQFVELRERKRLVQKKADQLQADAIVYNVMLQCQVEAAKAEELSAQMVELDERLSRLKRSF